MKTIVIDARTIDSSTGHYTHHLLKHIDRSFADEFRFVVLTPSKTAGKWSAEFPNLIVEKADEKSYSVAEQTSFVARLESYKPDLVHFTMPQQPFLWMKPSVTTVHDLTLVRYDNIDMNKYIYRVKKSVFVSLLRTVVMRSRAIITPTEFVKDDLLQYMGEKYRKKIYVTLEAGDPLEAQPEVIKGLDGKQFVFYVGNAFPYKNVERVIDAFSKLKKKYPNLHLALAGKKDYFYEQHEIYVKEKDISDVHFLGYISDGEKRWALQNCVAYTSASLSEGFNISQLEAMYEGAPVVISNATCHPEVAGDAALYFYPNSTDQLVKHISNLIENPTSREKMIKKGTERVKQFSWQRMAKQTVDVYKNALR
ncbi:MAG: glycosyltransferase family 1 protein [Candidatus Saccharimonadales bacterium]